MVRVRVRVRMLSLIFLKIITSCMDHVDSNIHTILSGLPPVHHTNHCFFAMNKSKKIQKITARLLLWHTVTGQNQLSP